MKRVILSLVMAMSLLTAAAFRLPPAAYAANGQEAWRAEFDEICSKTDVVASLKQPELKDLIERCDRLKPRIEKLDESAAKVYLKRLQMCRNLFVFMREPSSP